MNCNGFALGSFLSHLLHQWDFSGWQRSAASSPQLWEFWVWGRLWLGRFQQHVGTMQHALALLSIASSALWSQTHRLVFSWVILHYKAWENSLWGGCREGKPCCAQAGVGMGTLSNTWPTEGSRRAGLRAAGLAACFPSSPGVLHSSALPCSFLSLLLALMIHQSIKGWSTVDSRCLSVASGN